MTTVDDALKTYTAGIIEAKLISYLQSAQTPVTDWHEVGFLRSLLMLWGETALPDVVGPADPDLKHRARMVAGAVPALAARPTAVASRWLTLVAEQIFNVRRNYALDGTQFAGTFTQQALTLSCDASHGPYSIVAGKFWVRSPVTGNRYRAITSGTVPNNGSVLITVQAESPNDSLNGQNYADGAGTLTDIGSNPLPGVTASNVAPSFSGVVATKALAGLGIVTVGGATPAAPTNYDLKIVASGQAGTATFQYRANGGPWSATLATAASYVIAGGPTVYFTDDPGGSNPSFVADDGYRFQSPGTPITQQGLDPETDAALLIRCVARWPSLAPAPGRVLDKREVWARAASSLVTRARVSADPDNPGFANVTIAGVTNPLSGGVVSAVQIYINQRDGITDQSDVTAAAVVPITASANVYVPAANMSLVQAASAALWNAYVNSTDIGGTVRAAKLTEFLRDAGAVNVDYLNINGDQQVALGTSEVASAVDIITGPGALTWIAV